MGEPEQVAYLKDDVLFSGYYSPLDTTHCSPIIIGGRMPKNPGSTLETVNRNRDGSIRFYWDDTTLYAATQNAVSPPQHTGSFVKLENNQWVQPDPTYAYTTSAITKFDGAMVTAGGVYQGLVNVADLSSLDATKNLAITSALDLNGTIYIGAFYGGAYTLTNGSLTPIPGIVGDRDVYLFSIGTTVYAQDVNSVYTLTGGSFVAIPYDLNGDISITNVVVFEDTLYVGTTNGVFYLNPLLSVLISIDTTVGITDLTVVGPNLYALRDGLELITVTPSGVTSIISYLSPTLFTDATNLYVHTGESLVAYTGPESAHLIQDGAAADYTVIPRMVVTGPTATLICSDESPYLCSINTDTWQFTDTGFDQPVYAIVPSGNVFLLSTANGVYKYDPESGATHIASESVVQSPVFQGVDSNYYFAAYEGVYAITSDTYEATLLPASPGIGRNGAFKGYTLGGVSYIQTYDTRGGVYQVVNGVTTRMGGAFDTIVRSLMVDGGNLYAASSNKIYRWDTIEWTLWATVTAVGRENFIKRILRTTGGSILALMIDGGLWTVPDNGGDILDRATETFITDITPTLRAESTQAYLAQLTGSGRIDGPTPFLFSRDIACTLGDRLAGPEYVYDGTNFIELPGNTITSMCNTPDGILYNTEGGVSFSLDLGAGQTPFVFKDIDGYEISYPIIVNDSITYGGRDWLMTDRGMFYRTEVNTYIQDMNFHDGLPPPCVAYAIHNDILFIAASDGRLASFNSSNGQYASYAYNTPPTLVDAPTSLISFNSTLYMGTPFGLYSLANDDTLVRIVLPGEVVDTSDVSVKELHSFNSTLYCASDKGIFVTSGTTFSTIPISLPSAPGSTAIGSDMLVEHSGDLYSLVYYADANGIDRYYITKLTSGTSFVEVYALGECVSSILSYKGALTALFSSFSVHTRDAGFGCGGGREVARILDHTNTVIVPYVLSGVTTICDTDNGIYVGGSGLWHWNGSSWVSLSDSCPVSDIVPKNNITPPTIEVSSFTVEIQPVYTMFYAPRGNFVDSTVTVRDLTTKASQVTATTDIGQDANTLNRFPQLFNGSDPVLDSREISMLPPLTASPMINFDSVTVAQTGPDAYTVGFSWPSVAGATHYKVCLRYTYAGGPPPSGGQNASNNRGFNQNLSNGEIYNTSNKLAFTSDLGLQTGTSVTFDIGGSTPIPPSKITAYVFAYQNGVRGPIPKTCLFFGTFGGGIKQLQPVYMELFAGSTVYNGATSATITQLYTGEQALLSDVADGNAPQSVMSDPNVYITVNGVDMTGPLIIT